MTTDINDPEVAVAIAADLAAVLQTFSVDPLPPPAIIFDSDAVVAASAQACAGNRAISAFSNYSVKTTLEYMGVSYTYPVGPTCYFRSEWSPDDDDDRRKMRHEFAHYILTVARHMPYGQQEALAISMESVA